MDCENCFPSAVERIKVYERLWKSRYGSPQSPEARRMRAEVVRMFIRWERSRDWLMREASRVGVRTRTSISTTAVVEMVWTGAEG